MQRRQFIHHFDITARIIGNLLPQAFLTFIGSLKKPVNRLEQNLRNKQTKIRRAPLEQQGVLGDRKKAW